MSLLYNMNCSKAELSFDFVHILAGGKEIAATGDHIDANGLWETDGTQHWHTCSCGTKFDINSHSGGTATCKDKAVCLVCGVAYGELDASNHVGGTEIRDAVAVSCEVDGYTGDTYCKGCGVKVATGQSIPKTAHTIKEWTVTKEATTSESGEKTGKCTSCGQEFKAEIAKLSSNPIAKENIEYEGMKTVPQLEPEGQTVLPLSRELYRLYSHIRVILWSAHGCMIPIHNMFLKKMEAVVLK